MAIDKIFNDANVDGIADNIFGAVNNSVSEVKQMQQRKAAENVQMVVEAFKKIETNITEKFDNVTDVIEKRVLTIKDGRDGSSGSDGRNGRDGKPGRDGVNGKQGTPGTPGKDGTDGVDGVSVTDASIDFDGSLVISLSSGQQINVGEVVPPELERQLVELRQGGGSAGSSGDVMGPTASTDNAIARFDGTTGKLVQDSVVTIADTTGNMTGVGTLGVGAITTSGALVGTATQSAFNTVSTTLNLGGAATAVNIGAATGTLTVANTTLAAKAITASTTLGVTGVATLGNGAILGIPASGTVTNLTGTASININGTVGATTANTGAFTTLSASGTITASNATALTVPNGYQTLYRTTNDASSLAHLLFYRGTGAGAYSGIFTTGDTSNGVASLNLNFNGTDIAKASSTGLAVTGTLSATGTLSGGTSGTAYSFSGSAPATSLTLDSSGNLGIGVSSPLAVVDVLGSFFNGGSSRTNTNTKTFGFRVPHCFTATNPMNVIGGLSTTSVNNVYIGGSDSNIGGTAATDLYFYTAANNTTADGTLRMRIDASGIVTMSAYGAGAATFSASGVISSVSDETWKIKDGVPVDTDAMLKKLEPGYWYYNDEKKETFGSDRQLGFYAQNVNAAIGPEAAPTPEEGKPWGYYDRSVLAITVMSLQKALATIETLTARITALETA